MVRTRISRRSAVCSLGVAGFAGFNGSRAGTKPRGGTGDEISKRVDETWFIDTHEHLLEEHERLSGKSDRVRSDDWTFLISHYLNSDLVAAGMREERLDRFFSSGLDPVEKWDLLGAFWPAVRQTGYAMAVDIAVQRLYGQPGLARETISQVQESYRGLLKPGFYERVLKDASKIESCQVNCLSTPFRKSRQPLLLMQDISFLGMHMGPNIEAYAPAAGVQVRDLADWHLVIDWWFRTYGPYAVAVKSQAAYSRSLDYEQVPAEEAAPHFKKKLNGTPLEAEEEKALQDHLFWYCVRKATENNLPVKIHTGYYAGHNRMPLERVAGNPASAADLCRKSPDTCFIFMHIGYPFYEQMIALAKQYANAYLDMCWAWIMNPATSCLFLKHYLMAAPANKLLTFGGDYIPVEPVVGHAALARRGITLALSQLVEEGWISLQNALDLVQPLMRENANRLFSVEAKSRTLRSAPW